MQTALPVHLLDELQTGLVQLDATGAVCAANASARQLLNIRRSQPFPLPLAQWARFDPELRELIERNLRDNDRLGLREWPLQVDPARPAELVVLEITPVEDGLLLEMRAESRHRLIEYETRLEKQSSTQRQLIRSLAHEVKNPLGGMRGAAQLLRAELEDPERREYLDIIIKEADRLRELVDRLLGPAGKLRRARGNIHSVLDHVIDILAPNLPPGTKLLRDYDPSIPDFDFDSQRMVQVFLNLVVNAIDASGQSKDQNTDRNRHGITIRTRSDRQYTLAGKRHRLLARIEVIDHGPGVDADIVDSLFIPLVTSKESGSGMGLSIAQDIVQRHGGLIEYQRHNEQTIFTTRLPMGGDDNE